MKTRCIHLFPELEDISIINEIRKQYDPLYTKIRPHITLVFPFESSLTKDEIETHILKVLSGENSFNIELQQITAVDAFGHYLFLNIKSGSKNIIRLHEKLYTGLLSEVKPSWLEPNVYTPHMTVGNLETKELMLEAEKKVANIDNIFKTKISKVWVEEIDINDNSIIELEIELKK